MPQTIAVLTGDIVKSSRLSAGELDRLFAALDAAIADMRRWPDAPALLAWSRYRGDGWQMALGRPEWALRACLYLRAAIRAASAQFETRIGAGIGMADGVDAGDLGAATGPAFERSGRCLEDLGKHFLFGVDTADGDAKTASLFGSVFVMADALSRGWTQRQAEVMRYVLMPEAPNQTEIGANLRPPIAQQAVNDHYLVAHGPVLMAAIATVESL